MKYHLEFAERDTEIRNNIGVTGVVFIPKFEVVNVPTKVLIPTVNGTIHEVDVFRKTESYHHKSSCIMKKIERELQKHHDYFHLLLLA